MIGAGIVLYNPNIFRLKENLDAISKQVNYIFLVDNYSDNINEIKNLIKDYLDIELIENKENLGIAKGLNQIFVRAKEESYEWILTLDQDSIVQKGLINLYRKYMGLDRVCILTCKIKDRNFGFKKEDEFLEEFREVERCITSGSFIKVKEHTSTSSFDERMFIDYVDFDMCFTLREKGLLIFQCNFYGLLHEMGNSYIKKILKKEFIITEHTSLKRYYYFSRNIIFFIRKHNKKGYLDTGLYYRKAYGRILAILLYEKNKRKKFMASLIGLKDGYFIKII